MKDYPKKYEDVFTSQRTLKKCKVEDVGVDDKFNTGGTNEYINLLQSTFSGYQKMLFDYWVKMTWLIRRFCYKDVHRNRFHGANNHWLDGAYGIFMRKVVGFDNRFLTRSSFYSPIAGYFEELFPDFDTSNPFKSEYKYPYQYMILENLFLVYQMPERLELLEYGEKHKMSYLDFQDYIINYINCANEEVEDDIYSFYFCHRIGVPYVKYLK